MYRVYAARSADAHQPRHPPPPGAAAAERPPQDRADERAAVLAAGHAGHLLRRRDRHGRQRLPRRPQRRAHADAVERRPQRRFSRGQPAAALPAGRSSTPSTTTRRSTSRPSSSNPHSLLWWMKRLIALRKQHTVLRPRRRSSSCTPRTARCSRSCARDGEQHRPRGGQPLALRPVVELDLHEFRGLVPVELFGATEFAADRTSARTCSRSGPTASTGSRSSPSSPSTARRCRAASDLPVAQRLERLAHA